VDLRSVLLVYRDGKGPKGAREIRAGVVPVSLRA
jgi:hypothetical protein